MDKKTKRLINASLNSASFLEGIADDTTIEIWDIIRDIRSSVREIRGGK